MSELVLENKNNLPKQWVTVSLDDVIIPIKGKKPKNLGNHSASLSIPYIDIKSFEKKEFTNFTNEKICPKCSEDDVLIVWDGARSGLVGTGVSGVIGSTLAKLFCFEIEKKYLYYFLQMNYEKLNKNPKGIGIPHVNPELLYSLKFPLSTLNEQKRIVKKIEELFSELDYVQSTLKNINSQLEEYKQSLLKSAFEGNLTKKWREKNKPSLEELTKKIEEEKKNLDKKQQKILAEKVDFFKIPEDWAWIRVGEVSKDVQYGTSEKATTSKSKIPVLRMGNIQNGKLDFSKLKYYPNNWKNFKTFELVNGDVLFNRTNSAELVGKTAVYYEHHPPAVFAGYLIRVKLFENVYLPSLLSHYINSIFGKLYIRSVVTQQVGQANVNSTKLTLMPLPLMSYEEQKEIHSQLESYLSVIANTEKIVNSLLSKLDVLYSTILKLAFEGKLVPQDPNDEPVEILLQKIKKEKEQLLQKQKTSRRKKNVK